jgi:hypothetical protein
LIAAAPNANEPLDLIQLTLSLAADSQSSIPETLKDHFSGILEQAMELVKIKNEDFGKEGNWSPEAITFALFLRKNKDFESSFEGQTSIDNIDPVIAAKMLSQMKTYIAP